MECGELYDPERHAASGTRAQLPSVPYPTSPECAQNAGDNLRHKRVSPLPESRQGLESPTGLTKPSQDRRARAEIDITQGTRRMARNAKGISASQTASAAARERPRRSKAAQTGTAPRPRECTATVFGTRRAAESSSKHRGPKKRPGRQKCWPA